MKSYENYFLEKIQKNPEESKACIQRIIQYIESSSAAKVDEHFSLHPMIMPKIYSKEDYQRFCEITDTFYHICEKTILLYRTNPDFRKGFSFSKELEQDILLDPLYDCSLPIARFDIFYQEDSKDFKFCEINTDGTSAMNENKELYASLAYNSFYQDYLLSTNENYYEFELFHSWIKEFFEIYKEYAQKKGKPNKKPHVAIVDFLDKAYLADFTSFEKAFLEDGFSVEICDIRQLRYENGQLYSPKQIPIDAIYRRAVTSDIYQDTSLVTDFLDAYRNHDVCVIGGLMTQIIHNKEFFIQLRNPLLQAQLSEQEREFINAHVPFTKELTSATSIQYPLLSQKDRWILKPLDCYGASGIYLGYHYSQEQWEQIVASCCSKGYLFQEYCAPYATPNIDVTSEDCSIKEYHNLTGLYVYQGKFSGIYTRICENKIIAGQYGGKELPSLVEGIA